MKKSKVTVETKRKLWYDNDIIYGFMRGILR